MNNNKNNFIKDITILIVFLDDDYLSEKSIDGVITLASCTNFKEKYDA